MENDIIFNLLRCVCGEHGMSKFESSCINPIQRKSSGNQEAGSGSIPGNNTSRIDSMNTR